MLLFHLSVIITVMEILMYVCHISVCEVQLGQLDCVILEELLLRLVAMHFHCLHQFNHPNMIGVLPMVPLNSLDLVEDQLPVHIY